MGSIIRSSCSCGFTAEFFGGSEKQNYTTVCYAPALCLSCGGFHVLNYLNAECLCPACQQTVCFYNDAKLHEEKDGKGKEVTAAKPEVFILPRGTCLCPGCRQMTMHFEAVSCCE